MTRIRTLAPLVVTLALVAGCGLLKTEEQQKAARNTREGRLEVPPDLTTPAQDERFAVPDPRASTSFSQYSRDRSAAPQGTVATPQGVLPTVANVRLERAGDQRWIVAKADPAQVWPLVRDFWLDNGFGIAREAPEAGIMETNWRDTRARVESTGLRAFVELALPGMYSTSERDRFRTRLERGLEPGTTEIYVSHRGLEEVFTSMTQDATRWVPRGTGTDRDLEAEMLGRMLVKLGSGSAPTQATAGAAKPTPAAPGSKPPPAGFAGAAPTTPAAPANAVLENAGAGPLVVNDGFERAWRRVGLALDRVGFTVEDRDRTKGTFFVRYIDPDEDAKDTQGFLDKLAFWKPAPKTAMPQYRIQLADGGAGLTQVVVQNVKGEPENSPTSKRILSLLFEQLK